MRKNEQRIFFLNSKNKSVTIKGANRINVPKVLNSGTDNETEMLKRKKKKSTEKTSSSYEPDTPI